MPAAFTSFAQRTASSCMSFAKSARDMSWVSMPCEKSRSFTSGVCNARFPVHADPRIVAGGPRAGDILKCQLKPLARGDYAVGFTEEQWARLQAVFPAGVCNYAVPGIAQAAPQPWQTFAGGPGGQPLGPAPTSRPGDGN